MPDNHVDPAADSQTIAGYLAGREEDFRRVDGWILTTIDARYTSLESEREDLGQRVHEKLVTNLHAGTFRRGSTFRTYVTSVVHHTCIDALRRRYLRRLDVLPDGLPAREGNPYSHVEAREQRQILHRILDLSPEICRRLWRMILLDGLPYRTIGERLKIPAGTVKSRMSACRRKALAIFHRLRGQAMT